MPRHNRSMSSSHSSRYTNHLAGSLGPSSAAMYSQQPQQQRLTMPSSYYTMPSSATTQAISIPQTQQALPQSAHHYEPFNPSGSSAPAVSLPPQHRASSGAWTPEDDQQLLTARMQGLNWGQIHQTYFPTKSPNACRKRHERLMERKGADDWDNRKLQRLAKEYMSMRKEIWTGLAARTGEKWNVVEQKCMSNGLKNLQSAARAASRRDRLEAGAPFTGYDDDSGISGIALTPVDELDTSYSSPETSSSGGGHHSASSSTVSASGAHYGHHHSSSAHLNPHHQLQQSLGGAAYSLGPYGGGYGGAHHGYSSSVSSSASAQGYASHAGLGTSQSSSPYLHGQRLSSVDMGIDAIINRSGGTGV